jgi:hypothetical protein
VPPAELLAEPPAAKKAAAAVDKRGLGVPAAAVVHIAGFVLVKRMASGAVDADPLLKETDVGLLGAVKPRDQIQGAVATAVADSCAAEPRPRGPVHGEADVKVRQLWISPSVRNRSAAAEASS